MTELYLDGKIAYPSQNTTLSLTAENPYFTKTSSYTFDVEIPLAIPDNKILFGHQDRIDTTKEERSLEAKLIVDNATLLNGTAHIISSTEKSLKIQLLGDAATYNYGNKMDNTFIDQIDLGDWFWETWPDGSHRNTRRERNAESTWKFYPEGTVISYAAAVLTRARYKGVEHGDEQFTDEELIKKLLSGEFGWVAYPTYNMEAEIRHNAIAWRETAQGSRVYTRYLRDYDGEVGGRVYHNDTSEPAVASFAIQPMVWKMAEIIARATGFTLDKQDNALFTDSFFNKIFIVNTSTSALCNRCLPHWSVNEWWENIENTFGVVLSINYESRTMKIEKRADHYRNARIAYVNEVVDQFETTFEDESIKDISVNNVGFADFENGPEDLLADEIISSAEFMDFGSTAELISWCNANVLTLDKYKGVIFRCEDGRQYIYSTNVHEANGIIEVNMFRPRIAREDNEDIEIELKIVPARYSTQNADLFAKWIIQPGAANYHRDIPDGTFEVRMLSVPGVTPPQLDDDSAADLDIQAIIEGEEEAAKGSSSGLDLLYISIINPNDDDVYNTSVNLQSGGSVSATFRYPRGYLRERCYSPINGTLNYEDRGQSLSLIPIAGQMNLASATIANMCAIKTDVKYCIKFISNNIPDPGSIFIIRNKRFVCEKIEAKIKPDGLDKLLTGYFYEFEM